MQQPSGRVLRTLTGTADPQLQNSRDSSSDDLTPFRSLLRPVSSGTSSDGCGSNNNHDTQADPPVCSHGARIVTIAGPSQTPAPLTKTQLRIKRQQRRKRQRKNKAQRKKKACLRQGRATSPRKAGRKTPRQCRGHSFRAQVTRAAISIHHLRNMKDIRRNGGQHKGIRRMLNKFKDSITPAGPDQSFHTALAHDCEVLYRHTVKNVEHLHIRNALDGMEQAMTHYHGPTMEKDLITALTMATTRGTNLHPLAGRLTKALLYRHMIARKKKNPALTSYAHLRPVIDFQGTTTDPPPPDVTSEILRMVHSQADGDTPQGIIGPTDLPSSHIHIPLPPMRIEGGPPFQQFPKPHTYYVRYPKAPPTSIFEIMYSLNIHRTRPPTSFPKNRHRGIATDNPNDPLGINLLMEDGDIPCWAAHLAHAPRHTRNPCSWTRSRTQNSSGTSGTTR